MQNRPFENIQEMNQILIQNYNAVVHKNDTVYILGDISHHLPMDRANELISRLNGKKILIKGNNRNSLAVGLNHYLKYYCQAHVSWYASDSVVMPAFGGENTASDLRAAEILAALCPERKVVQIPARAILTGGGNIHCITQQIPKGDC